MCYLLLFEREKKERKKGRKEGRREGGRKEKERKKEEKKRKKEKKEKGGEKWPRGFSQGRYTKVFLADRCNLRLFYWSVLEFYVHLICWWLLFWLEIIKITQL
jgi:hypothetical protein